MHVIPRSPGIRKSPRPFTLGAFRGYFADCLGPPKQSDRRFENYGLPACRAPFVANGVTGVRDMGSELDIVQSWRNEIEAGRLIGPRIYTPGPMLDGAKPRFPSSAAIATPEDAHRASLISSGGARTSSSCNR